MKNNKNGIQVLALLLAAALGAPVALAGDTTQERLGGKVKQVQELVSALVDDGYDPSPIGEIMDKAGKALDKGDVKTAEPLIDDALAKAKSKDGLRRPRPAGKPAEIQARLEGKMKDLQSRVEAMMKAGKDTSTVEKDMKDFESLMKNGEVADAEKHLDSALDDAK